MKKIIVDPYVLETSSIKIEQLTQDFNIAVSQLYDSVDTLATTWIGKDNMAFNDQIKGFNDDFKKLHLMCLQYSDFLKTSAYAYKDTQNEVCAMAYKLYK